MPPVNLAYTNLTSTSVTLTWQPPPDDSHNGIIRHYIVQGREETGVSFMSTTIDTQISFGILHPYYIYNFTVSAVTISPGPYSDPLTVQALEDGKYI